jgi:hypothetical protein
LLNPQRNNIIYWEEKNNLDVSYDQLWIEIFDL